MEHFVRLAAGRLDALPMFDALIVRFGGEYHSGKRFGRDPAGEKLPPRRLVEKIKSPPLTEMEEEKLTEWATYLVEKKEKATVVEKTDNGIHPEEIIAPNPLPKEAPSLDTSEQRRDYRATLARQVLEKLEVDANKNSQSNEISTDKQLRISTLLNKMIEGKILANDPSIIEDQSQEMLKWDERGIQAMEKLVEVLAAEQPKEPS
jgi:hypothetical protein